MKIVSEPQASSGDKQFVRDSLNAYNEQFVEPLVYDSLSIFIRDEKEVIQGGILGSLYWKWMYITHFWVDESLRGQGLGSKLLLMAEQEVREKGYIGIHLETKDFQAPEFYESHGYKLVGKIENLPEGHTHFEYAKMLK